jgi:hypothetical protein
VLVCLVLSEPARSTSVRREIWSVVGSYKRGYNQTEQDDYGVMTDVSFAAVPTDDLDGDQSMATTALAVEKRSKDSSVELTELDERFSLLGGGDPELAEARNVPSGCLGVRIWVVVRRGRADGEGLACEEEGSVDRAGDLDVVDIAGVRCGRGWALGVLFNGSEQVVDLLVVDFGVREPDGIFVVSIQLDDGGICVQGCGGGGEMVCDDLGERGFVLRKWKGGSGRRKGGRGWRPLDTVQTDRTELIVPSAQDKSSSLGEYSRVRRLVSLRCC